jgi:large subunit ribosomal protein L25
MERITLNAEVRDKMGKGVARSLRRAGRVPAVVYKGGSATPLTLNTKETVMFIRSTHGEKVLVNLAFPDQQGRVAILKEYQRDPVRGDLLHVDFFEVSMTEKVRVGVHVVLLGEPIGVKRDKGILQAPLREIEVECLPDRIPGHIEIDVTGLLAGHSLHVRDLLIPEGVIVLTDGAEPVAIVTIPAATEAATTATAAEGEAVATAPEVVKKGKKEEAE